MLKAYYFHILCPDTILIVLMLCGKLPVTHQDQQVKFNHYQFLHSTLTNCCDSDNISITLTESSGSVDDNEATATVPLPRACAFP